MATSTGHKQKEKLDNYLKDRGRFITMRKHQIQPSADFTQKTILKIIEADSRRLLAIKIWVVVSVFMPVLTREAWLFVRRDYFSLTHWPYADQVISVYNFFLSGAAAMYLLGFGVLSAFMYLWGFRLLTPTFRFVGHLFEREQAGA